MKKILLIAILFFPALTLMVWVYLGMSRNPALQHTATGTNKTSIRIEQIETNSATPSGH